MKRHAGCGGDLSRVSEFIDGGLPAALCRRIRAHMGTCRPCRDFVASLKKAVALHRAVGRKGRVPPLVRAELSAALRACERGVSKSTSQRLTPA